MHIPSYWARAEHRFDPEGAYRVVVWRWSDTSLAEAEAAARARLAELVSELAAGRRPARPDYADRPVREERLEVHPATGEPFALVTRNAQGAEVLNAARVPFLDLDFADLQVQGLVGLLRRLFRRKVPADPEEQALRKVRGWLERERVSRARVYRTRSGLRVLVLDRLLDPAGKEAQRLLRGLGSDRLYTRLCRIQGSFRARLTPKPHRVGLKRIPHEWPPASEAEAEARRDWVARYREQAQGFAVCRLLLDHGAGPVSPEAARVRELHDQATLAFGPQPLA